MGLEGVKTVKIHIYTVSKILHLGMLNFQVIGKIMPLIWLALNLSKFFCKYYWPDLLMSNVDLLRRTDEEMGLKEVNIWKTPIFSQNFPLGSEWLLI